MRLSAVLRPFAVQGHRVGALCPAVFDNTIMPYMATYIYCFTATQKRGQIWQLKHKKRAAKKYVQENLERLYVYVPRGFKETLRDYVNSHGEKSVNSFVVRAIEDAMERENNTKEEI